MWQATDTEEVEKRTAEGNEVEEKETEEEGEEKELQATWLGTNINCILMTLYALKAIKLISYIASDTLERSRRSSRKRRSRRKGVASRQVELSSLLIYSPRTAFILDTLAAKATSPFRVHFEI